EAVKVMDALVTANPNSWQAHLARGRFHFAHGDLQAAALDFCNAHELSPQQTEVLLIAADAALRLDNFDEARVYIERRLRLQPKNEWLYCSLARLEARRQRHQEAIDCLHRGLAALPESIDLRVYLAELLLDSGESSDAEAATILVDLRRIEGADGIHWRAGE